MTALELRDLHHRYGAVTAVAAVDLALQPGEIVALLGRSGCGKTTLLRAIAGLLVPTSGTVELGGVVVADQGRERVPTERRGIGLVFQDYALFPSLSVAANVGFGLRGSDPERVRGLLERLGLSELASRRPAALSGGQQQRVGLARALAPRPSVLLLDEPFANLDSALRLELGALLREAVREEGTAALLVSHDRADALSLADRLVLMAPSEAGGRVIREGAPAAIYRDPQITEAALLTGEAWFLPAPRLLQGPVEGIAGLPSGPSQGGARLCVRPEDTVFVAGEGPARVRHAAFQGAVTHLLLEHPALKAPILAANPEPAEPGQSGSVEVRRWAWVSD